jgi:hypothetical protein
MSAHAGSVTVTGANGQNYPVEDAGGAATATMTTPGDPSNTATARRRFRSSTGRGNCDA